MHVPQKYLERIPDLDLYEKLVAEVKEAKFLDFFAGRLLICDGTPGPIEGSLGLSFEECKKKFMHLEDKGTNLGFPILDWNGRRHFGGEFLKRNYIKKLDPEYQYWSHNGDVVSIVDGDCEILTVPKGYSDPKLGCFRILRVRLN